MFDDRNLPCTVCSLWGCHRVGVILFRWDIRVVEKCGGFRLGCNLSNVVVFSFWAFAGVFGCNFLVLFVLCFVLRILPVYLGTPYAFNNICRLLIKKEKKKLTMNNSLLERPTIACLHLLVSL
jgi:hypothetical protein